MNKVEAWKLEKHGFDVRPDIEAYAARSTPMSEIAEAELERMKGYGLFYRKRVEDGRYMIRVRIPGCELDAAQARALAEIARIGYSILDVTTRGNVQIQGFAIADLPRVLDALDAARLTGRQTGHDNVRNVMTHPWAGLDPEELVDVVPLCRALTDVFMGSRDLSNLPRKFNVAVEGRARPALHCWTQDTSFVAARRDDGSIAFHWLLAGTQGQNPRLAWKPPVWVRADQAPAVLLESLEVFRAEGSRERRDRARLRYLIENIGLDGFLERVEDRLGYRLERNDEAIPDVNENEDFLGWFAQKQPGLWALGVSVPLGRLTHEQFAGLADLAATLGDGTLRTAYDQGIVIPRIPTRNKHAALRFLSRLGLEHEADSVTRNIIACTGRQFCNIAVSETKGHAFALMDRLRARGVALHGIKINMSGCPSSCAQTYTGDIGLKGVRVRRKGGTRDGFDVFLGGGAHGPVELALPYCKGVDVDQLPDLVANLVRTYDLEHAAGETFSLFWRRRIGESHKAEAVREDAHRPDVWLCEGCGHRHHGEDPPVFCPKCAGLRKLFARLDEGEAKATPDAVASVPAAASADETVRGDGFVDVGAWAALERDGRLAAGVGGREVAVFLDQGEPRCVDALCPHEGGPLVQGDVKNGAVSCPWHGWLFALKDGRAADANGCHIASYPVKVEAGRVLVDAARGVASGSGPAAADTSAPDVAAPRRDASEFTLRVLEIVDETHDVKTIRLDNADRRFPLHLPGQHVKLGLDVDGVRAWRSFTISSPPTRPNVLELTIKKNPQGVVSIAAHALRPGDSAHMRGPSGGFVFDPERHREPLVLAVAGSGVTPAMCILRVIHDLQLDNPVTLIYGSRAREDVIFRRELDQLRPRLAKFRMVVTLTRPDSLWTGAHGRVTPELVARHVPDLALARYFLCGPGEMRDTLIESLSALGVDPGRIHWEMFGKSTRAAATTA